MNWRAFGAIFRREVARGRRGMLLFAIIGAACIVLAILLSKEGGLIAATMSVMFGIFIAFAPLGDLRQDKTLGHLEFDRVLPVSHRAIATARLFGAGIRTSPLILYSIPFIIALDKGHEFGLVRLLLALGLPLVPWLLLTSFTWAMMAINIRWNLRRLWWLPMTIFIGPNVVISALPDSAKAAIKEWLVAVGEPAIAFFTTPVGIATIVALVVAIPLVLFWIAISIFASGLERYTYDASGSVMVLGAPPKRELAAAGRGPALAVARYCIRLATEQSRRRLILLGVFVVVLLVGSQEMKGYARFYLRALAAMFPAGIALQLSVARARGHLEGIQQLPHSARTIATGYLVGIVILAAPGAAIWVLARAVSGTPPTVSSAISLWAWMAGWSWLATVSVVWLTTRRTLMIAAVPLGALLAWVAIVGVNGFVDSARAAASNFAAFRVDAGVGFPLTLAIAMMLIGVPLFARGLAEYEFAPAKKQNWLVTWQDRVRARRGM